MMKNSKLSKLLVAGVSVAMLASALAPMAFAEGSDVAGVATPTSVTITVNTVTTTNGTTLSDVVAFKSTDETMMENWSNGGTLSGQMAYAKLNYTLAEDGTKVWQNDGKIDLNSLVFVDGKVWDNSGYVATTGWPSSLTGEDLKATKTAFDKYDYSGVFDVASCVGTSDATNVYLQLVIKDDTTPTATITLDESDIKDNTVTGAVGTFNTKYASTKFDDEIVLPRYAINRGFEWKNVDIEVTLDGNSWYHKITNVVNGGKFTLKDLGLTDEDGEGIGVVAVTVKPKIERKDNLTLKLDASAGAYVMDKDGDTPAAATASVTVQGVSTKDVQDLKTYNGSAASAVVYSGETVKLPAVEAIDSITHKKLDKYVFDHWEISSAGLYLNDGVTKAKGSAVTEFDPDDYAINNNDPADDDVTLIAVFKDTTVVEEDVITFDKFETPDDEVWRYVNGKKDKRVTFDEMMQEILDDDEYTFEGGAFLNEKTEVASYYVKNSKGDWMVDDTINGAKEGYVFKDGVQDTTVTGILDGAYYTKGAIDVEAYGLKKIAGAEDDPFFYLVSDGVYQSDYNGMWEDEDGSVYKLEKGCTNTTFTGVYDRGDWALSVKDSKVQKDETGFVLYGDKQYWFINGICNMKETEAVRQHTDGNFYYTVGAKIDFTFNGECNGHTFVNGVASK